ncbi:MAG: Gfo/Idh/MocA family oxidoreductase, partial [Verrucomicrobiota bacterium]
MSDTKSENTLTSGSTRRSFVKATGAVTAVGAASAFPSVSFGQENNKKLKIGVVGAGGRGGGAMMNALDADDNVEIWAVGDLYLENAEKKLASLTKTNKYGGRFTEGIEKRTFGGLDAYQKVIDSGVDILFCTTPPGFRPQHFQAAVDAGLHAFVEKPCATDVAGVLAFTETAKQAEAKGLSVLCGFCYRYSQNGRALFERIHDGAIGDILSIHSQYYAGPVKAMPDPSTRPEGMSDTEWQLKNWYNFTWLGGDGLVEQGCHNVDRVAWAMQDADPIAAFGSGGRQRPNNEGNIYDHFSVTYEYPNDVMAHVEWRQFVNSYNFTGDTIVGTKGVAKFGTAASVITGENPWRYRQPRTPKSMYVIEHEEFMNEIRTGGRKDDAAWIAHSTTMAIQGRNACYT